jgi:hypothetical protein
MILLPQLYNVSIENSVLITGRYWKQTSVEQREDVVLKMEYCSNRLSYRASVCGKKDSVISTLSMYDIKTQILKHY